MPVVPHHDVNGRRSKKKGKEKKHNTGLSLRSDPRHQTHKKCPTIAVWLVGSCEKVTTSRESASRTAACIKGNDCSKSKCPMSLEVSSSSRMACQKSNIKCRRAMHCRALEVIRVQCNWKCSGILFCSVSEATNTSSPRAPCCGALEAMTAV